MPHQFLSDVCHLLGQEIQQHWLQACSVSWILLHSGVNIRQQAKCKAINYSSLFYIILTLAFDLPLKYGNYWFYQPGLWGYQSSHVTEAANLSATRFQMLGRFEGRVSLYS